MLWLSCSKKPKMSGHRWYFQFAYRKGSGGDGSSDSCLDQYTNTQRMFFLCCGNTLNKLLKKMTAYHATEQVTTILSWVLKLFNASWLGSSPHSFFQAGACLPSRSFFWTTLNAVVLSSLLPASVNPFLSFPLTIKWPISGCMQVYAKVSCKRDFSILFIFPKSSVYLFCTLIMCLLNCVPASSSFLLVSGRAVAKK